MTRLDSIVRSGHFDRLWAKDPHSCVWCSRWLAPRTATLDHFMPRSLGGPNIRANLVLSCGPCNSARGSLGATRWAHACVMAGHRVQIRHLLGRIEASLEDVRGAAEFAPLVAYLEDKRRGLTALRERLRPARRAELETFLMKRAEREALVA